MSRREKIFDIGLYAAWREESDKILKLSFKHYSELSSKYGVRRDIVMYKTMNVIEVYEMSDDDREVWNVKSIAYIELDDNEFNRLLEKARNVKTLKDIEHITKEVEGIWKKLDEEIGKKIEEFIDQFITLRNVQEELKLLEDEKKREKLKEFLKEKLYEYLIDYVSE